MAESGRKTSTSAGLDRAEKWRQVCPIGPVDKPGCRRIFARSGEKDDLVLVRTKKDFFVLEAWCVHQGGPLFEGDIEDYNGKPHIICPWHGYMYDVESGAMNFIPELKQRRYPTKLEAGILFVLYHSDVSLTKFPENVL